MTAAFAPDWPVLQEWLRSGDCVLAVYDRAPPVDTAYIGLATYDHVLEGLYLRHTIVMSGADWGTQMLPRLKPPADPKNPFKISGRAPRFFPRAEITALVFYDPVWWLDYLQQELWRKL